MWCSFIKHFLAKRAEKTLEWLEKTLEWEWESAIRGKWDARGNFLEGEMKKAIDSSYAEGAPGPDGFSFLFYQKFWSVIKTDFMALVRGFERGGINIARINYAMIILIPKEEEARILKKFRPISLITIVLKYLPKPWTTS
jgi:hypothetical protein